MVSATRELSLWGVRPRVLVVSLFAAAIACAQSPATEPENLEGRTISRVDFDPADQPLPASELAHLLPFAQGSKLKTSEIREAIQKLYATGRYSDISISGEPEGTGAVAIRIVTQFVFFVSSVAVEGVAEPPTKGQLLTAAKLQLGSPFEDSDVEQATENLEDRLRANGLYHATVSNSIERFPHTEEVRI